MVEDFEDQLKEQRCQYEDLLDRHNREHETDDNLLSLLQSDLDKATTERSVDNYIMHIHTHITHVSA